MQPLLGVAGVSASQTVAYSVPPLAVSSALCTRRTIDA